MGSIFEQRGHLNSDVVILDLFFVAGVVVVGGGVLRPPQRLGDIVQCVG